VLLFVLVLGCENGVCINDPMEVTQFNTAAAQRSKAVGRRKQMLLSSMT